jgi:hypothetical protein
MNRATNKNESRRLRADNEAAANDGKRYILIFDNHPASLRLLRELHIDSGGSTLSQYLLLNIALVILGFALVVAWFT